MPPISSNPNQTAPPGNYDFILNPPSSRKGFNLPGGQSTLIRVVYVLGLLLLILVAIVILKSLLGSSNQSYFVKVLEDQAEIVHLATAAPNQPNLSGSLTNFSATAEASVYSSEANLYNYLAAVGHKVSANQVNQSISGSIDSDLSSASASGDYDATYQQAIKNVLSVYLDNLSSAYTHSQGSSSLTQLRSDYAQGQLLLKNVSQATL